MEAASVPAIESFLGQGSIADRIKELGSGRLLPQATGTLDQDRIFQPSHVGPPQV